MRRASWALLRWSQGSRLTSSIQSTSLHLPLLPALYHSIVLANPFEILAQQATSRMSSVSSQIAVDLDIFEDLDLVATFDSNTLEVRRAQMHEQCLKLANNGFEYEALSLFYSISTAADAIRCLSTSISLLEIMQSRPESFQRTVLFRMAFGLRQVAMSRFYRTTTSKYLIPEQVIENAIVTALSSFQRSRVARFLALAAFSGNFESVVHNLQKHEEHAKSTGVYDSFVAKVQEGTRVSRSSEERRKNERQVQMLLKERLLDQSDSDDIFEGD